MGCYRSPLLTQLFGVVDSDPFTLVAYEGKFMLEALIVDAEILLELVNADKFTDHYWEKDKIVYHYLDCTFVRSASGSVVPADKCSLGYCNRIFARGQDSDISGELFIFRIDRRIIAIRLPIVGRIGRSTRKCRLGITIRRP